MLIRLTSINPLLGFANFLHGVLDHTIDLRIGEVLVYFLTILVSPRYNRGRAKGEKYDHDTAEPDWQRTLYEVKRP